MLTTFSSKLKNLEISPSKLSVSKFESNLFKNFLTPLAGYAFCCFHKFQIVNDDELLMLEISIIINI